MVRYDMGFVLCCVEQCWTVLRYINNTISYYVMSCHVTSYQFTWYSLYHMVSCFYVDVTLLACGWPSSFPRSLLSSQRRDLSLSLSIGMCIYIYIYTHTYIYIYVYIYIDVCVYIYIYIYLSVSLSLYIYIYIHIHMCAYIYI